MRLTDTVHEQQHGQYVVDHNPDSQGPQHVLTCWFPWTVIAVQEECCLS